MKDIDPTLLSRRQTLECMAWAGIGVVWTVTGGVPRSSLIGAAKADETGFSFVQVSDSHIGFAKPANPDARATLKEAIGRVTGLARKPAFVLHTGDITHSAKPGEFDDAAQILGDLHLDIHYAPGEHDITSPATQKAYLERYGAGATPGGWYAFDQGGVHFISLVNVVDLKANGLGYLGAEQLAWLDSDLRGRSASAPIVVFAHIPLWMVAPEWGWGTDDGAQALQMLARFGSVTVLNGHIHQIVQKVEGNMTFHTARPTSYPQPLAGVGSGPGPLKVPADQLAGMLGITSVSVVKHPSALALDDTALA